MYFISNITCISFCSLVFLDILFVLMSQTESGSINVVVHHKTKQLCTFLLKFVELHNQLGLSTMYKLKLCSKHKTKQLCTLLLKFIELHNQFY